MHFMIAVDCVSSGKSLFVAVHTPGFTYGFERSSDYPKGFDAAGLQRLLRGREVRVYAEAVEPLKDFLRRSTVDAIPGRPADRAGANAYRVGMFTAKRNAADLVTGNRRRDLRRLLG